MRFEVYELTTGKGIETHGTRGAAEHAVEVLNAHEAANGRETRYGIRERR